MSRSVAGKNAEGCARLEGPHRGAWPLSRGAYATVLFSLVAYAATVVVGLSGLLMILANQVGVATFLGRILPISAATTAAIFLVGLGLHLSALHIRRLAAGSERVGKTRHSTNNMERASDHAEGHEAPRH